MSQTAYDQILPSEGLPLSSKYILNWEDINYTVKTKKETISILKGVSGHANSGQILAIMGSSGSGKTSLLGILADRIARQPGLEVTGTVKLNQKNIRDFQSNHYIKYVLQEDWLFATLTVRESLQFAAQLKIPNLNREKMEERVEEIIKSLKLTKASDNIIGNSMRKGVSGGEKKRVSIGIELISYPSVLILDEPTSGLDSHTAESVFDVLKEQANSGKMIIMTIHQPSTKIFRGFDRLILMTEGEFIYQGDAFKSIEHFAKIGFECPQETNPPDYYMKILYVESRKNMTKKEKKTLKKFSKNYLAFRDEEDTQPDYSNLAEIAEKVHFSDSTFTTQFKVIFGRALLNVKRQPMLSFVKIFQAIFMSVIIILLFHSNTNTNNSIQNLQGVLFLNCINFITFAAQAQALTFPLERPIFMKEYKENLYGVAAYLTAKGASEIPFQIIFTIIYCCIIYFVIPYNTHVTKFFTFFGIAFLTQVAGNTMGYMVGSLTSNLSFAVTIGPTIMMIFMIYGGFFSNTSSLAQAFYWVRYLSPFNYTYRAFIINEFTDFDFGNNARLDPIIVLNFEGSVWENALYLLCVSVGFFVFAFISLKIFGEVYRKRA